VLNPLEAPPIGDVTAAHAKAVLGGKVCIEGNVQIGDLERCSSEQIREQTAELIQQAGAGGGLIVCPTASPYFPECSDQLLANYRAMIETALARGPY
jgi:hypothetical protein